jgi:hypothetical protein
LQNKPSVKEAPFALFRGTPNEKNTNEMEIARLSYVTVSNKNDLVFKVWTNEGCPSGPSPCLRSFDVGDWAQNDDDEFRIELNLETLNPALKNRVKVFVNGVEKLNINASRATAFKHIGYLLTGIDAGIIASDDWFVTRLADTPPQ